MPPLISRQPISDGGDGSGMPSGAIPEGVHMDSTGQKKVEIDSIYRFLLSLRGDYTIFTIEG
jgi:hypothetical protein